MSASLRHNSDSAASSAKPEEMVKFSDQLTTSLNRITDMVNEHKTMIDTMQSVALELTHSIGTLHTLTVRYAGVANGLLDMLLPVVRNIPLIPDGVTEKLTNLESLTQRIINNKAQTAKTIADVQVGLRNGDVNMIKNHASDLQEVTRTLTAILPKS